jgi:hypothetical protein
MRGRRQRGDNRAAIFRLSLNSAKALGDGDLVGVVGSPSVGSWQSDLPDSGDTIDSYGSAWKKCVGLTALRGWGRYPLQSGHLDRG